MWATHQRGNFTCSPPTTQGPLPTAKAQTSASQWPFGHWQNGYSSAEQQGHRCTPRGQARGVGRELRGEEETETVVEAQRLPSTVNRRSGGRRRANQSAGVHVEGLDDIMIRLSRCCSPVPPDEIIGFVTRGRGVSVHRSDCLNATELSEGQPQLKHRSSKGIAWNRYQESCKGKV